MSLAQNTILLWKVLKVYKSTREISAFSGGVLGIWADTYARFEVWPTHPSIYQNFLPRPIHLPNFLPIFALELIYTKIWRSNPSIYRFCQFLLFNPSIYQNYTLKPIHLPKFHTFFGKWPTHDPFSFAVFLNHLIFFRIWGSLFL